MADDVKRWSVTYTKHIKQKRKVYQDGFLELQSSSHKVNLYDDYDKLLDSKIVKLDDAVRSGETLTFGAYLVDVGDPHGESKPIPNLILQRDKTMGDKDGTLNSKTSKGGFHIREASSFNLSPPQKIIREFKRREVEKYSSSPSCQDTMKADATEWQVLYTTQLTQKAKKFHDGILRVAISGLRGRQAVLYDETRGLLDSKFLKNDEIISAGKSLRFDGHIVDIIEVNDHKPLKDTNVDGSNCYTKNTAQLKIHNEHLAEFKKRETNKSSGTTSCLYTTKTNLTEWDVMYTTQVTQKAKKFHDGILKLSSCGSQGRQEATLLAEDGTVLSHRYLKLSEDINNGILFNMQSYLVEVGEPRNHSEGECPRKASTLENEIPKIKNSDADKIILSKLIPATRPLSDDKVVPTTISENKPLRNAHSILSFLKKPSTQEDVAIEKVHVNELHPSQDSSVIQSGIQYQVEKRQTKTCEYGGPISNCKAVDTGISLETIISADSNIMVDKQQKDTEVMSSKATFTSNFNEPAKETKNQSNTEISGDTIVTDGSMHDNNIVAGPTTSDSNHHDVNDRKKGFENTKLRNVDFPSFDLGFD